MRNAALLLMLALSSACGGEADSTPENRIMIDDALKSDLTTISGVRIFFGHQSVGDNILNGLASLSRECGIEVKLEDGRLGQNTKPLEKFEDFAQRAESGSSEGVRIISMKLCYVDIEADTDTDALIEAYKNAVARARQARPEATVVHVTPALRTRGSGLKSKLSRVLGHTAGADRANAKRVEFGEKLLAAFPGEPCFDLARVESTRPDGTREEHDVDGRSVPMLWPGYSSDGGHLNELGERVTARAFAHVLAVALRD